MTARCQGPVRLVVNAIEDATDAGSRHHQLEPCTGRGVCGAGSGSELRAKSGRAGDRRVRKLPDERLSGEVSGQVWGGAGGGGDGLQQPAGAYSPKGDELDLSAPGGMRRIPVLSTWPAEIIESLP